MWRTQADKVKIFRKTSSLTSGQGALHSVVYFDKSPLVTFLCAISAVRLSRWSTNYQQEFLYKLIILWKQGEQGLGDWPTQKFPLRSTQKAEEFQASPPLFIPELWKIPNKKNGWTWTLCFSKDIVRKTLFILGNTFCYSHILCTGFGSRSGFGWNCYPGHGDHQPRFRRKLRWLPFDLWTWVGLPPAFLVSPISNKGVYGTRMIP